MAAFINGTAVNFAFYGTNALAVPGQGVDTSAVFTGFFIQSGDVSMMAENEMIKDDNGDSAARVWYDQSRKGTLEWIPKGTSIANALVASTINTIPLGSFLKIGTCTAMPDLQAMWKITDLKVSKSNTSAAKVSFSLEYHSAIQTRAA